jgi:hypothetical protein
MTPFLVILGLELTAGEVLAIAGGISLLIAAKQMNDFLANPDNARRLNLELERVGEKLGEMATLGAVGAASTESAAKALEGLRESRRHLEVLSKQLHGTAEAGQQLLNKVTGLLNQIDSLTADLSTQVQSGQSSPSEPTAPATTPSPPIPLDLPLTPIDNQVGDRARRELQRTEPVPSSGRWWESIVLRGPSATRPSTTHYPSSPTGSPIILETFGGVPANEVPIQQDLNQTRDIINRTNPPWMGGRAPTHISNIPVTTTSQPGDWTGSNAQTGGRSRTRQRTRTRSEAPTDIAQPPQCPEPGSWIETFKQLLKEFGEEIGEELGQQAIEDMSNRAGKQFQEAFEARAEAIRRNPNFDKDKPDLAALMKQVIGKKYSDLSPDVVRDLKKYYEVVNNPDGSIKLNRHKGHGGGKDPTLPLIQFHKATGRIIPESINRRANGPNLSAEYAKQHGFNPGVGKVFEQQANIRSQLQGAVQFHHLITWSTWASHELTQAIQSQINQLPASQRKGVPGRDHGLNLIAAFRSPESRQAYENALRTNPTAAQNIQQLQARGNFLTEVFHNGSHPGWDRHVQDVLAEQVKSLKRDHPGKKLSEMPPAALNKAYENAVTTLRNDLNRVNQKIRDRRPLTDKESDWTKDYCPTPESEPHHRISQTPQRNQVSMPNLGRAYEESRASTSANVGFRMADIQELALRQFEADPRWRKRKAMAQELAMETPSAQASQMNGSSNPIWGELLQSARTLNEFNNQQVDTNPSQSPAIAETIQSAHHKIQGGFEIG